MQCWFRGEWCVILDVPLLIEANLYKCVGSITVVYVYVKGATLTDKQK
jgi:dephospho-CoA kinase